MCDKFDAVPTAVIVGYNGVTNAWINPNVITEIEAPKSVVCEFLGFSNLAMAAKVEATSKLYASHDATLTNDGYWAEDFLTVSGIKKKLNKTGGP
jgi:hypothetical protein